MAAMPWLAGLSGVKKLIIEEMNSGKRTVGTLQ